MSARWIAIKTQTKSKLEKRKHTRKQMNTIKRWCSLSHRHNAYMYRIYMSEKHRYESEPSNAWERPSFKKSFADGPYHALIHHNREKKIKKRWPEMGEWAKTLTKSNKFSIEKALGAIVSFDSDMNIAINTFFFFVDFFQEKISREEHLLTGANKMKRNTKQKQKKRGKAEEQSTTEWRGISCSVCVFFFFFLLLFPR